LALFQRKPLSELTPAYRTRIERAEAQGFTRSQARGHATRRELRITEVRLAEAPDNKQYLLKRVRQLKDPALIKQWNDLQVASRKAKGKPAGSPEVRKRDRLAQDLAHQIANTDKGQDLYAVHTYRPFAGRELEELDDAEGFDEEE
jgi:hypothetical protein